MNILGVKTRNGQYDKKYMDVLPGQFSLLQILVIVLDPEQVPP